MTTATKWKREPLESLCQTIDYGHTASATADPTGPRFLRITDIQNSSVDWDTVPHCPATQSETEKYGLRGGDIVFARTGNTTGKSFLIKSCPESTVFASYLIRVRPNRKVEPRFLGHFFDTPDYWHQIARSAQGAGQPGVNASKLKQLEIPLPPLSEQKRIADILDKADAIRRNRQEADQHADTIGMALFYDQFGDPRSNPKEWETGTLGDLVHSAKDGPHVSPEYAAEGIPFLSTRNIRPGRLIWEDLKFISQAEADRQWRKCKPEYGDILYTKGGTTGYAKCVDFYEEFAVWVHVAVLKTNAEVANPLWLETMLNTPYCYVQSQRHTRGIVNRDLGLTRMVNIEVLMPPKNEQDKFERRLKVIQETLRRRQQATSEAEDLFDSLVQRAFKGEL